MLGEDANGSHLISQFRLCAFENFRAFRSFTVGFTGFLPRLSRLMPSRLTISSRPRRVFLCWDFGDTPFDYPRVGTWQFTAVACTRYSIKQIQLQILDWVGVDSTFFQPGEMKLFPFFNRVRNDEKWYLINGHIAEKKLLSLMTPL